MNATSLIHVWVFVIGYLYYGARMMSQNVIKGNMMNVFDRKAKRLQRESAATREDYRVFNYLKDEVILKIKTNSKSVCIEQLILDTGWLQII